MTGFARRGKNRIYYRVVDEYGGDTLTEARARTSIRPLTLRALESFLNGAWSIFGVLDMNFGDGGYNVDEMLRFVVGVDSQFYPQIGALYAQRIQAWATERRVNLEDEEADEDGAARSSSDSDSSSDAREAH